MNLLPYILKTAFAYADILSNPHNKEIFIH